MKLRIANKIFGNVYRYNLQQMRRALARQRIAHQLWIKHNPDEWASWIIDEMVLPTPEEADKELRAAGLVPGELGRELRLRLEAAVAVEGCPMMKPTQRSIDRIKELQSLESGWTSYDDSRPMCQHLRENVERYAAQVEAVIPDDLYIYSCGDGGVQFEWDKPCKAELGYDVETGGWDLWLRDHGDTSFKDFDAALAAVTDHVSS